MRGTLHLKKGKSTIILAIFFAAFILAFPVRTIFTIDRTTNDTELAGNEDKLRGPGYAEGEVLVKFKKGVNISTVDGIADGVSSHIRKHYRTISRIKGHVYAHLKSDIKTTQELLKELRKNPDVADVSPNYILYADTTIPNDPRFNELWGLHNTGQTGGTPDMDIDAPEAWDIYTGSSDVIAAVLDTGITYNHPDLAANMWVNPNEIPNGADNDGNGYIDDIHGINAITGSGDPMDDNSHGTHCAGTIGAAGDNGIGVAGVNWNVKLMATKFLNSSGSGSTSNAITCIEYIIEQKLYAGQNIVAINASYGGESYSQISKDAIDAAGEAGIVFCAAAGNNSTNNDITPHYPSSYTCSNIIAVTAVDHNGSRYYNYGATSVDLAAPGRSILSTVLCTYTPQPGDIFYDDMESGGNLWTHDGVLDSWDITNADAGGLEDYWVDRSYGNFWSDSPGTDYIHNVDSFLATADNIDLSSYIGQTVYLGFDGGFQFDYFKSNDTAVVEISNNGGADWDTLADLKLLYFGYGYYYLKQTYTIPDTYKTANFRFRFHITTDNTDYVYFGYKNKGWIIDNIGIGTDATCGYGYKDGTSMATPHVTGAAAFIAGYYTSDTVAQRIARILDNVVPLPSLDGYCVTGGMLNLHSSLGVVIPTITVTSPNGGEYWPRGSTQQITWSGTGPIENVKIEYSIGEDTIWTEIIASTPNDGTYSWTIPYELYGSCLIRISDIDGDPSDESNARFSIVTYATITITSPNGGEVWVPGSSHAITWTCSHPEDEVRLEYSTNNGISWMEIDSFAYNDGYYPWIVPNTPSALCLVRVTETDGYPSDVSDDVFTIETPILILTSPTGGENWSIGDIHNITWTASESVGDVALEYSVNNGSSWLEIIASTANDGCYEWTIPNDPSESCRVRISDTEGPLSDQSGSPFCILAIPSITLTSPNGGENIEAGSLFNITWTSKWVTGDIKIEYKTRDRPWQQIIVSTPNDGSYTWTVPNSAAETFLVRVSETDGDPSDVSDAEFTVFLPPYITVTSPNGGEYWLVGSIHNITWTGYGISGYLKIDYSTDNGVSWISITTSTPDNGYHPWTIPNNPSAQCLVRVSEKDGEPSDTSNNVFAICSQPTIIVTSPNGGENWQTGSSHNITWTSVGTVGNVKIDYSTNNGASWTSVTSSTANDGSHPWTIPNNPSTQCLVRISETDGEPSDTSNAVFTISAQPNITITAPNGSEYWQVGSSHNITWTSTDTVGNVSIEYSHNNGGIWRTIVTSTANDGSYNWTIPDAPSTQCLVRINETDGSPSDVADSVFTIAYPPSITVTSPNGGEKWQTGSSQNIIWTSTEVANVKILYSIDNGGTWTEIADSVTNTGNYLWTVPENPSNNCLIQVGDIDDAPMDVSNAVFAIVSEPQSTITVTSPNGGENLETGTVLEITWTSSGSVDNVSILYSTDNGSGWETIVDSTENDGTYNWTVPAISSEDCLVKITEKGNDHPSDTSDSVFSIISPSITVTSPNGGEHLTIGSTHQITWTSTGTIGNVSIDYSTDSGTSWTSIVDAAQNDGTHNWTIPATPSEHCLLRIRETDEDKGKRDSSNTEFSILPPPNDEIIVLSPNGGETLYAGFIHNITWSASETIVNVAINYSTDNGALWTEITASTPNEGSYEWTVPQIPSDTCLIRVGNADGESSDTSDAVFAIAVPDTITVTSPNGGETLYADSEHEITWTSTGDITDVAIDYSIDNGKSWLNVVSSTVNDGSHYWKVPGNPSENCRVRVRESREDANPSDISDAKFTIDASSFSSITVNSPNGGETLYAGSIFAITWVSTGSIDDVKIEYTTDGESSWTEIADSTPNDGSYSWTVPGTPSADCLVRISDTTGNPSPVSDQSDAVFEISTETQPTITVTSPNGGETLTAGLTHGITWTYTGTIENVHIEYSSDGGTNWSMIETPVPNTGFYNWTIPDTRSENCLLRISGADGDAAPSDVSDAVFSITNSAPSITVTSPNGREQLVVDTIFEITWTTSGEIETVIIEYSADNGVSWTTIASPTPNDGSYEWTVPDTPSENCRLRIKANDDDNSPSDTNDSVFTILVQIYTGGRQGCSYERNPDSSIGPKIPGVKLTWVIEDRTLTKVVTTDETGYYKISLPPGRYIVTATHPDFNTVGPITYIAVSADVYPIYNFFLTRK